MKAEIQVIPFAIFNRHNPVVAAVRVTKGIIVRQMTVKTKEGNIIGTIIHIEDNKKTDMLQGIANEVYAIRIDSVDGSVPLSSETLTLECFI